MAEFKRRLEVELVITTATEALADAVAAEIVSEEWAREVLTRSGDAGVMGPWVVGVPSHAHEIHKIRGPRSKKV